MSATETVAVVTGASRGAGRGIALALAETGATVYVTARTQSEGTQPLPGTVFRTAEEVTERGGVGVPVICDHSDDDQVRQLFEHVARESSRLDILVNNAFAVPAALTEPGPFWEHPLDLQIMFDVGLRSSYVSSYFTAPLLLRTGEHHPLVVNTSGFGGGCYMHGPAYGAVKAGVDKMAHDMAVDFEPYNVSAVSLWMGLLRTERTLRVFAAEPDKYGAAAAITESPEFTGRVIAALHRQADRQKWNGRIVVGAELGAELGVVDVDGVTPGSRRPLLGKPTEYNPAVID